MRQFPYIQAFSVLLTLPLYLHCQCKCNGKQTSLIDNELRTLAEKGHYECDISKVNKCTLDSKNGANLDHLLYQRSIEKYGKTLGFENMTSLEDIKNEMDKGRGAFLLSLKNYIDFATLEERFVKILTKRLEILRDEMNVLKRYLSNYEDSSGQAILNARGSTDTPEQRGKIVGKSSVLGHRMTHRYATELSYLRNLYTSMEYKENQYNLTQTIIFKKKKAWVKTEDLYLSMTAIGHLQDVLMYQVDELQKGKTIDTQAGGELKSIHCAEMGMFALYQDRFVMSVEWLELANSLSRSDLTEMLTRLVAQAHNKAKAFLMRRPNYQLSLNLYTLPISAHQLPQTRTRIRNKKFQQNRGYSTKSGKFEARAQFSELCLGETLRPLNLTKDLRCYYENKKHLYFYISPIKTEELSEEPLVLQFYNIIGNKANAELQRSLQNLLKIIEFTKGPEHYRVIKTRTSAVADVIPELAPSGLYSLATFLTGLRILNNSDLTQFMEYTYGKYNNEHADFYQNDISSRDRLEKNGDRLATLLYYLELPDLGGLTPFCQGGFSPHLVRNSVVFWYNLYRNGTARKDVVHGACPVVHGNKVILSHWIYDRGNFDRYKCSLNQYE